MRTSIILPALSAAVFASAVAEEARKPPFTLDLKQQKGMSTMVLYQHEGPPPWPQGNCITFGEWHVVNMHAENIRAFERKSGVHNLEVRPIDGARVVVIDARVPGEWLRVSPCKHCASLQQRLAWLVRYKKNFQVLPEMEKLVGSAWELVAREDTDYRDRVEDRIHANIIEALLPGDRIEFREAVVTCSSAAGGPGGKRSWELGKEGDALMLSVYDLNAKTGHYQGIRFRVDRLDDELRLVAVRRIRKNDRGTGYSNLSKQRTKAGVLYRLPGKEN